MGRGKSGGCNECRREKKRKDPKDFKKKGRPFQQFCKKGHDTHIVGRIQGRCKECSRENLRKLREDIKEGIREIKHRSNICRKGHDIAIVGRRPYGTCIECQRLQREKRKELFPDELALHMIKISAKRRLRIVPWGQEGMREFYGNCPEGMEGDHIIPLLGRKVSGLHVRWNLQYLTRPENTSKNNRCNLKEISEWYGKILEEAGLK